MKKLIGGLVCVLLLVTGLPAAATIELEGTIQAEMPAQWTGLVTPSINLTVDQSVAIAMGSNNSVNETLRIQVEKVVNYERFFLLPRYLFVQVLVLQDSVLPIDTVIRGRAHKAFVINSPFIGGNNASEELYIDIPLSYDVPEDTTSEGLYVHVLAAGILPGGSPEERIFPIAYQRVNLEVTYT